MTRRIANVLIVAVMAVTILRAGSVISVDDAAEFWFVGYVAAFVFDALTIRESVL